MSLAGFKSISLPLAQLSLPAVLKCGQSFLWTVLTPLSQNPANSSESPHTHTEYRMCLRDRVVCLRQSSDTLFYRAVFPKPPSSETAQLVRDAETLEWLKDYFQLDVDLVNLYKQWADKDKVFAKFQDRFEGIRMLRQDPWENLISFICSSNNNISRITKMVQSLCKQYSPPLLSLEHPFLPTEMLAYHPFPSPSVLADPPVGPQLRTLGFGYRADYVQRTARMLVDSHGSTKLMTLGQTLEASEIWLRQLRKLSTEDARQELLKFIGVGRKVADCVLLMSLNKSEVVPVDTHVRQIAIKYYGLKGSISGKATMTPKLYGETNSKFLAIWGDHAGWAHSVLFTADLKSFSSYGLPPRSAPVPAPFMLKKKGRKDVMVEDNLLPTPPITPSRLPLKRKSEPEFACELEAPPTLMSQLCIDTAESLSLVDRVKKRRRGQ